MNPAPPVTRDRGADLGMLVIVDQATLPCADFPPWSELLAGIAGRAMTSASSRTNWFATAASEHLSEPSHGPFPPSPFRKPPSPSTGQTPVPRCAHPHATT